MRLSTFIFCVIATVVCVLIIEPNTSEASRHHKIRLAKKLAGLLLMTGGSKFIIPLPLPLPLPIPIFKSKQPVIVHEQVPVSLHHVLHGKYGGIGHGGVGGYGGIGGLKGGHV